MSQFDWDTELTDEDRDAFIEKMAAKIAQFGMFTPAILFLEMNKPISFLTGQATVLASGVLAPLFGFQNVQQFSRLCEDRSNVEKLIQRIEELSEDELESSKKQVKPRKAVTPEAQG